MPKANEASNKMLEGKPLEEVFTRLNKKKPYSPRKPVDEPSVNLAGHEESVNGANISMHRGAPISIALYDMNKARI